jgi:hypothetical protein
MRDPLWLLARQWQFGEYQGNDGGSSHDATISVQSPPLGLALNHRTEV